MKKPRNARRAQGMSVRERAYRYIKQLISEGALGAGSPISELQLAKDLDSSRTPIREGMKQLDVEGLLEHWPNGGMTVAQLKREDIVSGARASGKEQNRRSVESDPGFHALLVSMTNNSRIQRIIHDTRLLIRVFAIRRRGHDAAQLQSIYDFHQQILDAVAARDRKVAMKAMADRIQASQHERLNEYGAWRRETAPRHHLSGIFDANVLACLS